MINPSKGLLKIERRRGGAEFAYGLVCLVAIFAIAGGADLGFYRLNHSVGVVIAVIGSFSVVAVWRGSQFMRSDIYLGLCHALGQGIRLLRRRTAK